MLLRILVFSGLIFFQSLSSKAQFYTLDWKQKAGADGVYSSVTDAAGNTYITGSFHSGQFGAYTLTAVSGFTDIFIVKYNAAGTCLWAKRAGGMGNDWGYGIAIDNNGNLALTGEISSGSFADFDAFLISSAGQGDVFIAKYDTAGTCLWVRGAGGSTDDIGYGITFDISGNIYAVGRSCTGATFTGVTAPSQGLFLVKYSPTGSCTWIRNSNSGGSDEARDVVTDPAGNVFITGKFDGTASFGSFSVTGTGSTADYFLAKYTSSGTCSWVKATGGANTDCGQTLMLDASGNIFVAGYFYNTVNFGCTTYTTTSTGFETFVAKYNSLGNCQWINRGIGGNGNWPLDIVQDAYGYTYVSGWFQQNITFDGLTLTASGFTNKDVFVAKFDPNGSCSGAFRIGAANEEYGAGLGIDSLHALYLTGEFKGTVDFDPGPGTSNMTSTSSSTENIFLAKFDLCTPFLTSEDTTSCKGTVYVFPDSASTSVTSTHTSYLLDSTGCDSIITTFVEFIPNNTITVNADTVIANDSLATYQWLYCDSAFALVPGETDQLFHPVSSGSYAVEVNQNGCIDTSSCAFISLTLLYENQNELLVQIYPNPTQDFIFVEGLSSGNFSLCDLSGKVLLNGELRANMKINLSAILSGYYVLTIKSDYHKPISFPIQKIN